MSTARKPHPSDVSDGEWKFLLPCLTLMREDALQREDNLRAVFNAMRYVVNSGCQWRYMPHEFPPCSAVCQQARRWMEAKGFEEIARTSHRVAAHRRTPRAPDGGDFRRPHTVVEALERRSTEALDKAPETLTFINSLASRLRSVISS